MSKKEPQGSLAIQTMAMPADTNANGDMFGGWLVSQMDLAGGVIAKLHAKSRVVTVAIDSMVFQRPVHVGDLVCCYADVIKTGNTSITLNIEAWIICCTTNVKHQVTEGVFTYVAIDDDGKPRPISKR